MRLSHDATPSLRAINFQYLIALWKCFELDQGQSVVIENHGDVSVDGEAQIEAKHEVGSLTDMSISFWKTIKNWIQTGFDHTRYPSLVLLTTQKYGSKTKLKSWNESDQDSRMNTLHEIYSVATDKYLARRNVNANRKGSEVFEIMKFIFNDNSKLSRLRKIVSKVWISASNGDFETAYEQLKKVYCKGILESKRDDFLNSLLGYIINVKKENSPSWQITEQEFTAKVQALTSQYCKGTIQFPRKHMGSLLSTLERESLLTSQFVEKLEEIDYHRVINDAITDFFYASKTISEEFADYQIEESSLSAFVEDTKIRFTSEHRRRTRNCVNIIHDSQNFFDEFTISTVGVFPGLETPNLRFRNGVIHIQLNDVEQNLKWRLETNE